MNRNFPRPKLFSSKCLGFAACRWNGVTIPDELVEKLKAFVDFVTACPEAEIGLGIPRDPVRIVIGSSGKSLIQLNTEKDVTKNMKKYVSDLIKSFGDDIDGFILKDRSPSCGIRDVKAYSSVKPGSMSKKTAGFFGGEVVRRFPGLAVESEARLANYSIREHFLTRLFTLAAFREIKKNLLIKDLVKFHAENKFLLMAYSEKEMRLMGHTVANHGRKRAASVFAEYEGHLQNALSNAPRYASKQTFFEPYPFELVRVRDSGKGRGA